VGKKSSKKSGSKASAKDAQIVMQLYDLRREAKMREARKFCVSDFQPQSADDVIRVVTAFGTPECTYFQQVYTYWSMAASLVVYGAVDKQLFQAWSGEMVFVWAKIQPYINQLRAALSSPEYLGHIETVVEAEPEGRKRRHDMQERQKRFRAMQAAASK
jgi:hypothetical protein